MKPSISCCIIAKDEGATLGRLLQTIQPYMSQIVTVDTGSIDNTKEVAESFGADVFDFDWCNDYSAARNFSFSKATGDYICWYDGHDVVNLDFMEELMSLLKQDYDIINANYLTHFNKAGEVEQSTYRMRVAKRSLNPTWKGIIHEALYCNYQTFATMTNAIEHRPVPKPEGHVRPNYLTLLEKNVQVYPDDARAWFYLGREQYYHHNYEDSIKSFTICFYKSDYWNDQKVWAKIYMARCYMYIGKYEEAKKEAMRAIAIGPEWPDCDFVMGEINYFSQNWQEAINWFLKARVKKEPETTMIKDKTIYSYNASLNYLPICYDKIGNHEVGLIESKYAYEMNPDSQMAKQNYEYFSEVISNKLKNIHKKSLAICRPGAIGDIIMTMNYISKFKKEYEIIDYYCDSSIYYKLYKFIELTNIVSNIYPMEQFNSSKYDKIYNPIIYPLYSGYPKIKMKKHLLEYISNEFNIEIDSNSLIISKYQIYNCPVDKYITIHNKTGWSIYKECNKFQEFINEFKTKYPEISVIQIGGPEDPQLNNIDMSMIGKTFEENLQIQSNALLHVGLDSVYNHTTNILWDGKKKVPGVVLFGSTQVEASGYSQNINISLNLPCQPCFRENPNMTISPITPAICPNPPGQTWESPCHACMAGISVDMVMDAVAKILSKI